LSTCPFHKPPGSATRNNPAEGRSRIAAIRTKNGSENLRALREKYISTTSPSVRLPAKILRRPWLAGQDCLLKRFDNPVPIWMA